MIWAAARFDDLKWCKPQSVSLDLRGLRAVLMRTKMSGPGKRLEVLTVWISRLAFLAAPDWLYKGADLWQHRIGTSKCIKSIR